MINAIEAAGRGDGSSVMKVFVGMMLLFLTTNAHAQAEHATTMTNNPWSQRCPACLGETGRGDEIVSVR